MTSAANTHGPRAVLYVEDHPVNAMLMTHLFKHRPGLALVNAATGEQALVLAQTLHPVLLLIDLHLPDCLGTQLLRVLRLMPGCATTSAVAVTADHEFNIAGTGFRERWTKPLDLHRVLQRLDALTRALPEPTATADMPALAARRAALPLPAGTPGLTLTPRQPGARSLPSWP